MNRKIISQSEIGNRSMRKSLFAIAFICCTFLLPIHGQESSVSKSQMMEIIAKTHATETEMLRMKLLLEEEKIRMQLLIIIFGVVLSVCGASFTLILYFSRLQIRKRNELLSYQNNEIQNQNAEIGAQREEILIQAEQLSLKNEFLIDQNKRLEELNREKDGLIGIVAHDLRTPLNQSKGFAELLRNTSLSADQQILVNMITRVNDDGLRLIRDLLQINAMSYERLELTSVLLDQFIHDTIAKMFLPIALKKGIGLHVAIEQELTITTDPQCLRRILENLVSNALKFSPAGSNVLLRVLSSNDAVYISVEDQGPGISEEDQRKMFRKFQKLSARPTSDEPSTGLGLAIVKGLVEKLGGELKVKSELGIGSTFIVRLNKALSEISAAFQNLDQPSGERPMSDIFQFAKV